MLMEKQEAYRCQNRKSVDRLYKEEEKLVGKALVFKLVFRIQLFHQLVFLFYCSRLT